jgi:hypothetical protein
MLDKALSTIPTMLLGLSAQDNIIHTSLFSTLLLLSMYRRIIAQFLKLDIIIFSVPRSVVFLCEAATEMDAPIIGR